MNSPSRWEIESECKRAYLFGDSEWSFVIRAEFSMCNAAEITSVEPYTFSDFEWRICMCITFAHALS